nr:DUF3427 domain-containing protein [uncultured Sphingomonas sp.]
MPLEYLPRPAGTSDVFVRAAEPFTAELGKATPARDQERQRFFEEQVRQIAWHLGEDRVPVFLDFNGERRRMDKGCVGHAVASGFIEPPVNGSSGYVEYVKLTGAPAQNGEAQLWRAYKREDIAELFGHVFSAGAWNQGFVVQGQDVFLLVTLDKSGHHEDHHYMDGFVSPALFRWQSQNRTAQSSSHGKIISGEAPGYRVHLFVRARKLHDGLGAPFVYCGPLTFVSWEGEQPITVMWRLPKPLPDELAKAFGAGEGA